MNNAQCRAALQHGFNPYAAHPDTGGFFSSIAHAVSSVGKGIAKVASEPGKLAAQAARAAHIPGAKYVAMAVAPQTIATQMGGQVANATLNTIAHPNLANIAANAQLALRNAGPVGMVASGAIGAMKAGLSGKNLESIAWAAAEGAAPAGIDTAIKAAEALRHGKSLLTTALTAASSAFAPATPEAFGFDTAVATLKNSASKVAMGVARNALPSEGARRAFDAAVGVVSAAAKGSSSLSNIVPRAGSMVNIALTRAIPKLSAMPSATQAVLDAIHLNPSLMAGSRSLLATSMRTNVATVNDAMKLAHNNGRSLLPWRSMAPHTVAFIRKYAPNAPLAALRHSHTNIGGLDATGTTYIAEKGDGPWAIAQKLTGNGNRYKELYDVNKDKKPTMDKNVWVGEVINLPISWQKPVAVAPAPVALPAAPLPTVPTIAPVPSLPSAVSVTPGILQGKSILVAWSKTDGINQSGVPDYGLNAADLSTTMGPRDTLELQGFQAWDNKTLGDNLPVNGNLDAATLTALQNWATARASQALPARTPSITVIPDPNPLPDVKNPTVVIPTVIGGTTPATPTVAPAAAKSGSMAPVALGAIAGGLLFGLPGALIGAAGGAAIS